MTGAPRGGHAARPTLSGLVRRINSEAETFAADSPKKLGKFVERTGA